MDAIIKTGGILVKNSQPVTPTFFFNSRRPENCNCTMATKIDTELIPTDERVKVTESDWKWLKVIETDWKWVKMTENDWNRLKAQAGQNNT